MTLDDFSAMTQRVIQDKGFDDFQPTACFPARRHFQVLANMIPEMDPEQTVLEWAGKIAQTNEEFFVAFKIAANRFKIVRRVGPYSEDETFTLADR